MARHSGTWSGMRETQDRGRDKGCRRRPGDFKGEVTQDPAWEEGREERPSQVGGVVGRVPAQVESHWLKPPCRRKLP